MCDVRCVMILGKGDDVVETMMFMIVDDDLVYDDVVDDDDVHDCRWVDMQNFMATGKTSRRTRCAKPCAGSQMVKHKKLNKETRVNFESVGSGSVKSVNLDPLDYGSVWIRWITDPFGSEIRWI